MRGCDYRVGVRDGLKRCLEKWLVIWENRDTLYTVYTRARAGRVRLVFEAGWSSASIARQCCGR